MGRRHFNRSREHAFEVGLTVLLDGIEVTMSRAGA